MLLEASGLTMRFGGITAVSNVDLSVAEGSIRGIIGPNGSGKSTLFNLISGIYTPEASGRIIFNGEDITRMPSHEVARRGVARTFQMLRIFSEMTVLENLLIGYHQHIRYSVVAAIAGVNRVWREERRVRDELMDLLSVVGLADYAGMRAGGLSIGQQRLLAMGRAIAMKPKLLMLDEPAAGLSPLNVDILIASIMQLKQKYALTIIIVEHILRVVLETCEEVAVLDHGEKIAEGPANKIKDDHRVIEAYLGKEMGDAEVRAFLGT